MCWQEWYFMWGWYVCLILIIFRGKLEQTKRTWCNKRASDRKVVQRLTSMRHTCSVVGCFWCHLRVGVYGHRRMVTETSNNRISPQLLLLRRKRLSSRDVPVRWLKSPVDGNLFSAAEDVDLDLAQVVFWCSFTVLSPLRFTHLSVDCCLYQANTLSQFSQARNGANLFSGSTKMAFAGISTLFRFSLAGIGTHVAFFSRSKRNKTSLETSTKSAITPSLTSHMTSNVNHRNKTLWP